MGTLFKLIGALVALLIVAVVSLSAFAPKTLAVLAVDAERDRAGLHRQELDIPGFHIVYLEGGHGEPLLLLHGFGADKDNWTRVARFLTPHYRVIAPDLPGFGESAKPDGADYGIPAQAGYVGAIAEALHLQHFDLGGNSMGGWLAAAYAATHPQQVHSLWLLAPAGVSTAQPSDLANIIGSGGRNPLVARTPAEFRDLLRFVFVKPPYVPGAVIQVLAQQRAQNFELEQKIFQQLRDSPPLEPQVGGLQTPTLIVWGDHDRALHYSGAEVLHKLMPNSSVVILPDIGHLPMLEAVKRSAADYLQFRQGLQ